MNQPAKPSPLIYKIPALLLIAGLALGIAYFYQQSYRLKAVDEWVRTYSVNAMVLKKHPGTYTRFIQHFTPYYEKDQQEGLAEGQLEMQQIINVNYLTDYVWTVKDEALTRFLQAQLALLDALVRADGGRPGLCEQYYGNSALYAQVQQKAGGRLFLDFMLASEKLILSAEDDVPYKITPDHANYYTARTAANNAFWASFRRLHPELRTRDQLEKAHDLFNPIISCAGYAERIRALLAMDPGFMSFDWRAGMEGDRPAAEVQRRLRGSE